MTTTVSLSRAESRACETSPHRRDRRCAHAPQTPASLLRRYLFTPLRRRPTKRCDSGGVLKVDVLGHEAGRANVSDPALHGLVNNGVGHPSLHLAGLHR